MTVAASPRPSEPTARSTYSPSSALRSGPTAVGLESAEVAGQASTVPRVSWPPKTGEILPRASSAAGVREKLTAYSLNFENVHGAPKARSFERLLGITLEHIDQLEGAIRAGLLTTPVSSIRENAPHGVNCVVDVPVPGMGEKHEQIVNVRTVWELANRDAAPRLVTAYPKP